MPIPASIVFFAPRRVLGGGGMGTRAAPSGGGGHGVSVPPLVPDAELQCAVLSQKPIFLILIRYMKHLYIRWMRIPTPGRVEKTVRAKPSISGAPAGSNEKT